MFETNLQELAGSKICAVEHRVNKDISRRRQGLTEKLYYSPLLYPIIQMVFIINNLTSCMVAYISIQHFIGIVIYDDCR